VKKPGLAISIKQPFASAILAGFKRFEYRTRRTKIVGRVWIYASLKERTDKVAEPYWRKLGANPGDLPTGGIIGSVEIVGCKVHPAEGFAYSLKNPKKSRLRKAIGQPLPMFWRPRGWLD